MIDATARGSLVSQDGSRSTNGVSSWLKATTPLACRIVVSQYCILHRLCDSVVGELYAKPGKSVLGPSELHVECYSITNITIAGQ